ncbi:hypothetical protein FPV67DRAFT_1461615 [Lyophyllum atratum]|nr:hypothetical protein FPV67DRAFT_1461615 [Lyophyllum atratum]
MACSSSNHLGCVFALKTEFVTLTHARRRTKARILERWTKAWRQTPPTGGFGIANQFPPAWKLKDHVKSTSREVFSRLTQSRTRHAFIECPCGEEFQSREHVITQCPRYEEYRDILTDKFPELSLPDLLGTREGLEVYIKFLTKSGAFTKTGQPRNTPVTPELEDEDSEEEEDRWWERTGRRNVGDGSEEDEDEEEGGGGDGSEGGEEDEGGERD